jgi:hypothetical protein
MQVSPPPLRAAGVHRVLASPWRGSPPHARPSPHVGSVRVVVRSRAGRVWDSIDAVPCTSSSDRVRAVWRGMSPATRVSGLGLGFAEVGFQHVPEHVDGDEAGHEG